MEKKCEVIIFHFSIVPISFGAVWGSMLGGHWCFLVLFGVSCLGSCLSSSKSFSAKHFAGHPNPSQTYFIIGEKFEIDPSPARRWVMYGFNTKTMISPVGGSNSSSDPTSTQARPTPTQLRPKSDPSPTQPDPTPTEVRPKSDRNESKPSRTQPVSNPSPMRAEPQRSYIEPTTSKN